MTDQRDDPRPDEQLAREDDFDALYFRYRDWVVGLAYRFTRNHDDALDVLQETFAYLSRKMPGFVLTASMKTFLYPVVRNLSLELLRKRRPTLSDDEALNLLPARVEPSDPRTDLSIVLASLPAAQREVVLARFLDDLSLEEIAAALKIPLGTVKSRLHNALESLRANPLTRRYFED